ncbi:MAG: hypothetical protein Tsb002_07540 [Wenzhouxiangellaceae bacterium]
MNRDEVSAGIRQSLRPPLLLAAGNAVLSQLSGAGEGFGIFHLVLIAAMAWAGWRLNRELWGNHKLAAMAGPLVLVTGLLTAGLLHVLFADFSAASAAVAGSWAEQWPRLAYLLGLSLSALLVAPLATVISLTGAVLAEYL